MVRSSTSKGIPSFLLQTGETDGNVAHLPFHRMLQSSQEYFSRHRLGIGHRLSPLHSVIRPLCSPCKSDSVAFRDSRNTRQHSPNRSLLVRVLSSLPWFRTPPDRSLLELVTSWASMNTLSLLCGAPTAQAGISIGWTEYPARSRLWQISSRTYRSCFS